MSGVLQATEALRSALHRKGVDRQVQDAFNHLASCLVLLNSSSPSVQMINRLRSVLRQPLLPLYGACLLPTLQLSSHLLSAVLDKFCDASSNSNEKLCEAWDATAEVILSGVLDFLEQKDDNHDEFEVATWESLCRIICDFFFSDSSRGLPTPSIPLSLSAFNTLTEIAIRQPTIQSALRDKSILGGERLGAAISRTKDYLLAEALLNLFARLLPSIQNTSQGKFQRIKYVKAVLGSPKLFKCSPELVDIVQKTSGTLWDDVAAQIIDALARSDITYPQPFPIDEIDVCGRVFLQPLATDRIIMDKQAFLVNVVTENVDDPCESLQVPYAHIRTVIIDYSHGALPTGKALITIDLTSPPLVADKEMKSLSGSHLYAKFLLQSDSMSRFMEALRRRGVGKLHFANPPKKAVKPFKSISLGSGVKFGDDISLAPSSSFEDKVQLVNQVYNTNIDDSTTSEGLPAPQHGKERSALLSDPEAITQPPTLGEITPAIVPKGELSVSTQLSPRHHHHGELAMVTKAPDDKDACSDISEFEPEIDTSKNRARTSVSASRKPNPKGKQGATKRRRIGELDRKPKVSLPRNEKSPELTLKPQDSAWSLVENEKPLLPSELPDIDWSSSTRVDVSPPSSDTGPIVDMDVFGTQPPVSLDPPVIPKNTRKALGAKDDTLRDGNATDESVRKAPAESIITDIGIAEHASHQDRSPPPKIAGSRRKRETKPITLEAEGSAPPHKRIRRAKMEDNDTIEERSAPMDPVANTVVPRAKRYSRKKVSVATPVVDPLVSGSDDALEKTMPTRASTRRSERIKEKRTTATSGPQTKTTRGKIRKGKQSNARPSPTTDTNKSDAVSLPDSSDQISPGTPPVDSSAPISAPTIIEPLRIGEAIQGRTQAKTWIVEDVAPMNHVAQEIPQPRSIRPHEMSGPSAKLSRAPWEDFVRPAVSNPQHGEGFPINVGENTNDTDLAPGLSPVESDVHPPEDMIEYSVSLKGSEDSSEPFRPMESTPRKEVVTIDLTLDDYPIQQKRGSRKASAVPEGSKANVRASLDQPESTPTKQVGEELRTITPPHQNKRRSVTFASPIHYMLDNELESEPRVNTSTLVIPSGQTETPSKGSATPTGRLPSPGSDVLSPLIIPTAFENIKNEPFDQALSWEIPPKSKSLHGKQRLPYSIPNNPSPPKTKSRAKTMSSPSSDEVEIQDIVDVLNDIQAEIIKGVSNRFEKVRKDVRKGRDALVQQVLDELQSMAIDNAKYFNGLVGLEEAYHENAKAITRSWEDLIDCNENILVHFQNVLKEHDQNARELLPKSLSALKPVFTRGRLNV